MSSPQQAVGLAGHAEDNRTRRGATRRIPMPVVRLSLAVLLLAVMAETYIGLARFFGLPALPSDLSSLAGAWERIVAGAARVSPVPLRTTTYDVAVAPGAALPSTTLPAAGIAESASIFYGDKLKITFLESTGVPVQAGGAQPDQLVAVLFPRTDMSGDYTVDEAGFLDVPRLGHVHVLGLPTPALESKLGHAFSKALGRRGDVRVTIVDRLPVYVLGAVRVPGSIHYQPGMIALQALASAGGTDRVAGDISRAIEEIRETGRLRQAQDLLDGLLIRQAVLAADQADAAAIAVPQELASRLSVEEPDGRLHKLIEAGNLSLQGSHRSFREKQFLAARKVEVVKQELAAQTVRADLLTDLLEKKQVKLQALEAANARGNISQFRIADMQAEVADLVARREDARVMQAETQRRLLEAQIAEATARLDHAAGLQTAQSETQQRIDETEREIAAKEGVLQTLRRGQGESGPDDPAAHLTITRRQSGEMAVMAATTMTVLRPGDVVEAHSATRGLATALSTLQRP